MKESFVMHTENMEDWEALTIEQRGILITAILCYQTGNELPEMDRETAATFRPIRRRLDADNDKYNTVVKQRTEAGKRSAGARKAEAEKAATAEREATKANEGQREPTKGNESQRKSTKANESQREATKANESQREATKSTVFVSVSDTVSDTVSDKAKPKTNARADEERFDAFWSAYPKKVGRGDARRAWNKAHVTHEIFAKIMNTLQRATQSDQWKRDGGKYIPNPATWLNQERWNDDVSTYPRTVGKITNFDQRQDDIDDFAMKAIMRKMEGAL